MVSDSVGWEGVLIACRFWKLPRGVFKAAIHRIHLHPLVKDRALFPPIFCSSVNTKVIIGKRNHLLWTKSGTSESSALFREEKSPLPNQCKESSSERVKLVPSFTGLSYLYLKNLVVCYNFRLKQNHASVISYFIPQINLWEDIHWLQVASVISTRKQIAEQQGIRHPSSI